MFNAAFCRRQRITYRFLCRNSWFQLTSSLMVHTAYTVSDFQDGPRQQTFGNWSRMSIAVVHLYRWCTPSKTAQWQHFLTDFPVLWLKIMLLRGSTRNSNAREDYYRSWKIGIKAAVGSVKLILRLYLRIVKCLSVHAGSRRCSIRNWLLTLRIFEVVIL